MKVREVIDKCEELLDVGYTREDLLNCFNLVEKELALDYFPLYAKHQCNAQAVYYNELEHNPVRIVDCNCNFKILPTHIESKKTITEIKYTYTPSQKGLYDECSYDESYLDCLVHGVIAEYLCEQGFFEEAILWGKKYKEQIQKLYEVKE
jgi:hypothetical protein